MIYNYLLVYICSKDHPYNPHVFLKDCPATYAWPKPSANNSGKYVKNGSVGMKDSKPRKSWGHQDFNGMRMGGYPAQAAGNNGIIRNRSNNNVYAMTDNTNGVRTHSSNNANTYLMRTVGNAYNNKMYTTPPSSEIKSRSSHHSVDGASGSSNYLAKQFHSGSRYGTNSPNPYPPSQNTFSSPYGMIGLPDPTAPSFVPGSNMNKKN